MNKLYILFFYGLYAHSSFGSMYHKQIIDLLSGKSSFSTEKKNTHHCPGGSEFSDDPIIHHEFEVEIDCQHSCLEGNGQTISLKKTFSTQNNQLAKGDGYNDQFQMYGSLLSVFIQWSQDFCLEESVKKCGNLSKIKESKILQIKNKTWEKPWKPINFCQGTGTYNKDQIYLLPYDSSTKALSSSPPAKGKNESEKTPLEIDEFKKMNWQNVTMSYYKLSHAKNSNNDFNCQYPISGLCCYGDCLTMEEKFRPVLYENKLGNQKDQLKICGDQLVETLKQSTKSYSLRKSLCEQFFLKKINNYNQTTGHAYKMTGSTCSAFRVQADCHDYLMKVFPQKP